MRRAIGKSAGKSTAEHGQSKNELAEHGQYAHGKNGGMGAKKLGIGKTGAKSLKQVRQASAGDNRPVSAGPDRDSKNRSASPAAAKSGTARTGTRTNGGKQANPKITRNGTRNGKSNGGRRSGKALTIWDIAAGRGIPERPKSDVPRPELTTWMELEKEEAAKREGTAYRSEEAAKIGDPVMKSGLPYVENGKRSAPYNDGLPYDGLPYDGLPYDEGSPNRDGEGAAEIEATFSYSGRGFGFAVPDAPETGYNLTEDIFISPRHTMGAMTGDRVRVALWESGYRGGEPRKEGEVTAILSSNCQALVGTLHINRKTGGAYVVPDINRYNVRVGIPQKDCDTLSLVDGTKVEVVPEGAAAFRRETSRRREERRQQAESGGEKGGRRKNGRGPVQLLEKECADAEVEVDVYGRVSEVFGGAQTKEANYAAVLHSCAIATTFSRTALTQAEEAAKERLTQTERRDLRNKRIFTIDGADAKDLDDAISLEETEDGYVLGVHIADVSHYVPYGSPLEREAAERGTSVYFADQVVPMLPESLSNGSCSLNAGEDKYALTAEITLDKRGVRRGTKIYKSILRSKVRGVYSEINDLWEKGKNSPFYGKYASVAGDLARMRRLYGILRENGLRHGALELEDSEAVVLLDESGCPVDVVRRERGDAERLIEQFMLQANMGVAETLSAYGIPGLYRIHEEPDPDKIRDFLLFAHNLGLRTDGTGNKENRKTAAQTAEKRSEPGAGAPNRLSGAGLSDSARALSARLMGILNEAEERGLSEIVSSVLLRSMMKARYSPVCRGHFGLGADRYVHFTSPIRRYPDYFVHASLSETLAHLPGGALIYRNEELAQGVWQSAADRNRQNPWAERFAKDAAGRAELANDCEMRAVTAERAIEDLYIALYMSNKIGETFEATVCSVMRFGLFVRLPNLIEGLVPLGVFENASVNEAMHTVHADGRTYTLGSSLEVTLTEADVATGKLTFGLPTPAHRTAEKRKKAEDKVEPTAEPATEPHRTSGKRSSGGRRQTEKKPARPQNPPRRKAEPRRTTAPDEREEENDHTRA